MTGSQTSVSSPAVASPSAKDKAKYGVQGTPIPATRAFRKGCNFDQVHLDAGHRLDAWLLVDDRDGSVRRVNVYSVNGEGHHCGRHFDQNHPSVLMAVADLTKKRLKGYEPVEVGTCPVAVKVETEPAAETQAPSEGSAA